MPNTDKERETKAEPSHQKVPRPSNCQKVAGLFASWGELVGVEVYAELEAMIHLHHPNVVKFYAACFTFFFWWRLATKEAKSS